MSAPSRVPATLGPLGRLGRYTATHTRSVALAWLVLALMLGAFAPRVETALSGAGWEATGSQSVAARQIIQRDFRGLSSSGLMVVVHSPSQTFSDPAFQTTIRRAEAILRGDARVASVVPPQAGATVSRDGHTAIVQAGARGTTTQMVAAADALKGPLSASGRDGVQVSLTGASGMWSDFNAANRSAMMRSELLSWPVTLAILVLAFGSLVAAGLPLMLTILGLMTAAGSLFVASQIADVSIWAMNFALMFALALGIDYALFVVVRYRAALFGSEMSPVDAAAVAMDTAGKAVLFSGLTVLISLSAVMLVPSPAFRSMSLGIMLAVAFVLAATLTLLPAVLARLGTRVNSIGLRWVHQGEHRSPRFERWAALLWRRPAAFGVVALAVLLTLTVPVVGLRTGMPSIKVVPPGDSSRVGYAQVQSAFGLGAPGALQVVVPAAQASQARSVLTRDAGIARVAPALAGAGGQVLIQATPTSDPSSPAVGGTIDRLRSTLPTGTLVGGAVAENHDLQAALSQRTPLVIGVVLALGFLLLVLALQAPVAALIGVTTSLLATGAAFGVARLLFQDGHGASLLGFQSQGFLDAWGPVFFFAMIFAISMDYTVFLLASAKEHWDRSGDAREAAVGGVAHSGRVIFAAGAVMVAVFFTFALSGPLPPKEMGIILGVAVLLDAMLVRLLLVPVMLRMVGRWAWWLPKPLHRVLPDVRFGHAN
jgi:putative drug exporter of the RND superfamily